MTVTLAFDRAHFTALVSSALAIAFQELCQLVGNEKLYTFGLYTNGEGSYVSPTANTEEALLRKAAVYAARSDKLIHVHQMSLRWSPCDWEYHLVGGKQAFEQVDAYLASGWSEDYDVYHYNADTIYDCCLDALARFREEPLFRARANEFFLLLNLFMGDQTKALRLEWARQLNGVEYCARFERELEDGYSAFRAAGREHVGHS